MNRPSIREQLKARLEKEFDREMDLPERSYHGKVQLQNWDTSWTADAPGSIWRIASIYTMRTILKAKKWDVFRSGCTVTLSPTKGRY